MTIYSSTVLGSIPLTYLGCGDWRSETHEIKTPFGDWAFHVNLDAGHSLTVHACNARGDTIHTRNPVDPGCVMGYVFDHMLDVPGVYGE